MHLICYILKKKIEISIISDFNKITQSERERKRERKYFTFEL